MTDIAEKCLVLVARFEGKEVGFNQYVLPPPAAFPPPVAPQAPRPPPSTPRQGLRGGIASRRGSGSGQNRHPQRRRGLTQRGGSGGIQRGDQGAAGRGRGWGRGGQQRRP